MLLDNIHALCANVWAVIIYFYTRIHAILELGIALQVGGSLGQGPATEITHLGLNQPPVFQ